MTTLKEQLKLLDGEEFIYVYVHTKDKEVLHRDDVTSILKDSKYLDEEIGKVEISFKEQAIDIYLEKTSGEIHAEKIINTISIQLQEINLNLALLVNSKNSVSVKRRDIANPLFFFDPTKTGKEYSGSVRFKAINADLYSAEQIKKSLQIVDSVLLGG